MNPLYQSLMGSQIPQAPPVQPGNAMPPGGINENLQRFQQFRNTFKGDPRQQIQQMLSSGQVTQEQYNNAVQIANQLKAIINGR